MAAGDRSAAGFVFKRFQPAGQKMPPRCLLCSVVLAVTAVSLVQASHGDADLRFNYCRTRCVTRARCTEVGPLPLQQNEGAKEFGQAWQTEPPCTSESDVEDGVWWDGAYLESTVVPSSFEHVAATHFCLSRCREDPSCFFWTLKSLKSAAGEPASASVCLRQSTRSERHPDQRAPSLMGGKNRKLLHLSTALSPAGRARKNAPTPA